MKIALGSDRRGMDYKNRLKGFLQAHGYETVDCGTNMDKPVDYPIYAQRVGKLVASKECDFGVVVCATGIGICMAANKVEGIRCGIAYTDDVARLMREHNDANVICFGQNHMEYADCERRLGIFLGAAFAGDYHNIRIKQMGVLDKCGGGYLSTEFPEDFPVEQA